MQHPANRGVDVYGQGQAVLALLHFFPLSIMWAAAALFDRQLVDDSYGPVILALWVEQWVAPPAVGAFMVLLGIYCRGCSAVARAALRFVGSVILCIAVLAFGVAGLWGADVKPIFVYSITTPPMVMAMIWLGWRDLRAGLWGAKP